MNKLSTPLNTSVCGRQIAFFAAFVLPMYKLLELPSLLARFAEGDLLLPAILQFLLQLSTIIALLIAASKSNKTLCQRLEEKLGKWTRFIYAAYALVFLFVAVLPLLDLEKFVYAVFYDTSPTLFSFAAFFCTKDVRALGRLGDLSLFLFLLPFLALIAMSLVEADATNLLPFFNRPFPDTIQSITYTTPHFIDTLLLLPLICNLRFEKHDGAKITAGYLLGAVLTLLFLGVFYGVYSSVASRKHYAFAKIAQYFPVLSVVGRIDLIFVYMLCIVLFFYVATPLRHAVEYTAKASGYQSKTMLSFLVNFGAFLFVLFCNKYYDRIYAFFGGYAFPFLWAFGILAPLLFLFLPKHKDKEELP